jgi:hypothetical protein
MLRASLHLHELVLPLAIIPVPTDPFVNPSDIVSHTDTHAGRGLAVSPAVPTIVYP